MDRACECSPLDLHEVEYIDPMSKQENKLRKKMEELERHTNPGQSGPQVKESWLKRNGYWFFPIVPVMISSGFLATFFGLAVDRRIDAKTEQPNKDFRKLQSDVTEMRTKLEIFIDLLKPAASERLKSIAALPHEQFQSNLKSVAAALYAVNATDTKIDSAVTDKIQAEIQSTPASTSGYWPVVAALVTQGKAIRNGVRFEDALSAPSCRPPGPKSEYKEISCPKGTVLDIDNMTIEDSLFTDLIIRYRGLGPVDMKRVTFVNCSFLILLSGPPPASGQDLTRTIFQSVGPRITV